MSSSPTRRPTHVRQFLRLAQAGVYDGMAFHRVAPGFVIQTGALTTRAAPLTEKQQKLVHQPAARIQRHEAREGHRVDGARRGSRQRHRRRSSSARGRPRRSTGSTRRSAAWWTAWRPWRRSRRRPARARLRTRGSISRLFASCPRLPSASFETVSRYTPVKIPMAPCRVFEPETLVSALRTPRLCAILPRARPPKGEVEPWRRPRSSARGMRRPVRGRPRAGRRHCGSCPLKERSCESPTRIVGASFCGCSQEVHCWPWARSRPVPGIDSWRLDDWKLRKLKARSIASGNVVANPGGATNVFDFEATCKEKLPIAHFRYIEQSSENGAGVRRNRGGFTKFAIRNRRLVDTHKLDMSVQLFGTVWNTPIALSPCSSTQSVPSRRRVSGCQSCARERTPANPVDIRRRGRRRCRCRARQPRLVSAVSYGRLQRRACPAETRAGSRLSGRRRHRRFGRAWTVDAVPPAHELGQGRPTELRRVSPRRLCGLREAQGQLRWDSISPRSPWGRRRP